MNPVISIVQNARATECRDTRAVAIIEAIRSGRWLEPVERIRAEYQHGLAASGSEKQAKLAVDTLKKSLPGVTWSGKFERRCNTGLVAHSGLLCADLDDLGERLAAVRAILVEDPHVFALFTSPTGNGLKVVFRVEDDAKLHAASFAAVAQHVSHLCAVELDGACKDLARLCFVSFDLSAFLNRDPRVLPPLVETLSPQARPKPEERAARPGSTTDLDLRRRIAADLCGTVDWQDDTHGFCACPGRDHHTGANAPRDCRVHLDGAPTMHCVHNSCRAAVNAANRELRSRIGVAEAAPRVPGKDEEAFARLAKLSPAEFDRCRKDEAARLGIRADTLDAEVARFRAPTVTGQGRAAEFAEVEAWPEPVDGAAVLDAVSASFARFVSLPPHAAEALALWTAHAHAFECFVHTPRLNLSSPEKGCGKTTLLDVLASLVPRPLRTESITPAVLFRLVELHKPVLLLDEVDTFLPESDELRGLLNAGHKRGACAYRCEGERNEVRAFAAFAPAVLSGIGALGGKLSTLHDRSIVIRLVRAKPGEIKARFDSRRTATEHDLCRQLARWGADTRARLESADPALPDGAFNRLADNWRPLFAIAEAAGADWRARAAAAFHALTSGDDLDAHGIGAMLLGDIRDLFTAADTDRLPSAHLADRLGEMEGRPWAEFGKARRSISKNQLANQLRRFGISSRTIRTGDTTARGYHRDDFTDAFERYLPNHPLSNRHIVTSPENTGDSSLPLPSQPGALLRISSTGSACEISPCDAVTVQSGGAAGKEAVEYV